MTAVPAGVGEHPQAVVVPHQQAADVADAHRTLVGRARRRTGPSTRPRQVQVPANRCAAPRPAPPRTCRPRRAASAPSCCGARVARVGCTSVTGTPSGRRAHGCSRRMAGVTARDVVSQVDVRREEILAATVDADRPPRPGGRLRVGDVAAVAGRELGAGLLPLRHQGRPGRRGLRARGRARSRPARQGARAGDDPVERLRRMLRLYGPTGQRDRAGACGSTPGRSPSASRTSARSCARLDDAGRCAAAGGRGRRRGRRASPAPTRRRPCAASAALLDGLSVRDAGLRHASPAPSCASWVRRARRASSSGSTSPTLADTDGHLTPASARRSRGRSSAWPVHPERRQVGRRLAGR